MKIEEDKKREFLERARQILAEITLDGEFKEIKKPVYLDWFPIELLESGFFSNILTKDIEALWNPIGVLRENIPDIKKMLDDSSDFSMVNEVEPIFFNPVLADPPLWEYSDEEIKDLLRHELLHAELHCSDDNIEFVREAIERDIFIHTDNILKYTESFSKEELDKIFKYLKRRMKSFPSSQK